jgi:hypothetical protein
MPPNPYRRQPNINDMMYPKGSKQPRQVWAAVLNVYKAPPSTTPTTPTPTPSITASPTVTPTQTQSGTPQVTSTPTTTPSGTPQVTTTPTITPTNTNTGTPVPTTTPTQTVTPSRPASGTTEANTYLAAVISNGGTGLTSTISAATVTLFTSLVSNGLYSKMLAMYPLIGGVANSAKLNAVNIGTYDITWNGGMSFNVTGATGGLNAYGSTGIDYATLTSYFTNGAFGVYFNTALTGANQFPMGALGAAARTSIGGIINGVLMDWGCLPNPGGFGRVSVTTTPTGLYICSSTGTTLNRVLVNGSTVYTGTGPTKDTPGGVMELFRRSDPIYYNGTETFAFVSSALTPAEQTTLSTIINTYQTSLGRNTY